MTETSQGEIAEIVRCQSGDLDALGILYARHQKICYRTCQRILGDPGEAEDAVQELFLRVWRGIRDFRRESKFSTWLYRLAVNHCLNRLERRTRERESLRAIEATLETKGGADSAPALDSAEEADRLLSALPPDQRACLTLREIEGLSYEEIAEALEIPIGTVMSRLARARRAAREIVQSWE